MVAKIKEYNDCYYKKKKLTDTKKKNDEVLLETGNWKMINGINDLLAELLHCILSQCTNF